MSEWRMYENSFLKNTDYATLKTAAQNLGLDIDNTIKEVRNHYGSSRVDMAFVKDGKVLSIGLLINKDGLIELHGDFYGTGVSEKDFIDKLSQQYSKEMIINKISKTSNYSVESTSVNKNGEIELMVSCI